MNGHSKDLVQYPVAAFSLVFKKRDKHFHDTFSQNVANVCVVEHYVAEAGEMRFCNFHLIPFGLGETDLQGEIVRSYFKIYLMVSFRR